MRGWDLWATSLGNDFYCNEPPLKLHVVILVASNFVLYLLMLVSIHWHLIDPIVSLLHFLFVIDWLIESPAAKSTKIYDAYLAGTSTTWRGHQGLKGSFIQCKNMRIDVIFWSKSLRKKRMEGGGWVKIYGGDLEECQQPFLILFVGYLAIHMMMLMMIRIRTKVMMMMVMIMMI